MSNTKKPINVEIKKINRSNIYHHFLENQFLTKQQLVNDLQLCLPTVTKNIDDLVADGLIEKSGSLGHTGGRRAITYSLIKNARVALGIDITQNHVTIVALDLTGSIISSNRSRRHFEPTDDYYSYVGSTLDTFILDAGFQPDQILGVGIGLPALVDADKKSIFFSKIINLSSTTLEDFARYIPYPIELYNDANAAVFTETWTNHNMINAFYLMLSNNIGGSMIIDGNVYSGDAQRSGEIGHVPLIHNGKKCYCGQSGCVDAYLAATNLSNMTDGNLQAFFRDLENDDPAIVRVWDTYLDYLAATVNILRMLLDCNVILGGYVGEYLEPYMEELKKRAARLNTFSDDAEYLKICSYKKESIAAGAALYFVDAFTKAL